MNGRKRIVNILITLLMLMLTVVSVSALGNSEAGKPEVIASNPESSLQKEKNEYPPEGWITDIKVAYNLAQADGKQILINFTGSDWCVWCKRLSKEVFNTPEFKAYADESLVLLFLDFPNSIDLPKEQVSHNQLIGQILNVKGYPSIWLLDNDFSPLMVTGYREGGADEYIRHLSEDRPDISEDERENFRGSFTEAVEANLGPLK